MTGCRFFILVPLVFLAVGCTDTATFVTSTSVGVAVNANTQQVQIGYDRAELFQGPDYPNTGEAPEAFGFMGSDLAPFNEHIRQLYATGEAAALVSLPATQILPCDTPVKDSLYNGCPSQPAALTGVRRPFVFATGTSLGISVGFTSGTPTSIKFGYDREEISIIPLHKDTPSDNSPDKYASVLASIDMNFDAGSFAATNLKMVQFFATGAAARNLAKQATIRGIYGGVAANSANSSQIQASNTAIKQDQKDVDSYFNNGGGKSFVSLRDTLLLDRSLSSNDIPSQLKTAPDLPSFDATLTANATLIQPISQAARSLTPQH